MRKITSYLFSTINKYNPSCSDCKFHILNWHSDYNSPNNRCKKFTISNKYTDQRMYERVSICRADQTKCGLEGRHFERDPNAHSKRIMHYFDKYRHNY